MPNIIPRILFISDAEITTRLFLPVAKGLASIADKIESRLLDVSEICGPKNEFIEHGNSLFQENGFLVESLKSFGIDDDKQESSLSEYIIRLSDVFSKLKPKCIVVPHEFGWAFYAVQIAKKQGIPTYHLQHGFWGPANLGGDLPLVMAKRQDPVAPHIGAILSARENINDIILTETKLLREFISKIIKTLKNKARQLVAKAPHAKALIKQSAGTSSLEANTSRKGVWGPYYKRHMINLGIDPDTIDMVGSTLTDYFVNSPIKPYEQLCSEYGLDPNCKEFALYFWDPYERYPYMLVNYDQRKAFMEMATVLHELRPEMNILFLVHPRDSLEQHQRWLKSMALNFVRVGRTNLNHASLFTHTSLVIGTLSSVLAEAMLFRKPVLQLSYIVYDNLVPQLIEAGAVIPVLSHLHLRDQINRALNDKTYVERVLANQAALVNDIFYKFDGKAGVRAAKGIVSLIK